MKTPRIVSLPAVRFAASIAIAVTLVFASAHAAEPAATNRLPLWEIKGKRCTVFLLGSFHLLKKEHYPLPAAIENAFERSKIVVFETDVEATEKPELQAKLMEKAMLPEGQTLKSQLSPKTYEKLKQQLEDTGLPAEVVSGFKPGFVAMMLALIEMQKMGMDPTLGVDHHFYKRARKAGKTVQWFEDPQFQIDLVTGFSKEEGEAVLESTLKDIKTLKSELGKLIKAWQTGDTKELARILNEAVAEHPAIFKRLLLDRNVNWISQIEKLVEGDKDAIVIVGAGHLAGEKSVVELLEKKGMKVVQQ